MCYFCHEPITFLSSRSYIEWLTAVGHLNGLNTRFDQGCCILCNFRSFFPPTTFLALSFQKEPFGWLVKTERRCRTNRIVIFEGISKHPPRTCLICFFNHVHFIGNNDTSEASKIIKKLWKTFASMVWESNFDGVLEFILFLQVFDAVRNQNWFWSM